MKKEKVLIVFLTIVLSINSIAQNKAEFLQKNRMDLASENFTFPQTDFNIIGFGALHGSAKTYDVELKLMTALKKQDLLDYYIIEANYSQAFFFQKYLETGDEDLLKDLVLSFQAIVIQEGTIETFKHWKDLKELNKKYPNNPIKVIGFDIIYDYKYPIKHLLYLSKSDNNWETRTTLEKLIQNDKINFSIWNKDVSNIMESFVKDYEKNKEKYQSLISDMETFDFLINNIKYNFNRTYQNWDREKASFENYLYLYSKLNLKTKKQFAKYGYFHIQKNREAKNPSFFTRLIENNIYDRKKVISVMGYLTKSKVLWNKVYDKQGNYKSYATKKGFGISDYCLEYFKGIKLLKKNKISDMTLFRLNTENSPYHNGTDLVEIKRLLGRSNNKTLKGKNTLQFIDYAVLISNSKEQIPIEEIK